MRTENESARNQNVTLYTLLSHRMRSIKFHIKLRILPAKSNVYVRVHNADCTYVYKVAKILGGNETYLCVYYKLRLTDFRWMLAFLRV